MAISTETNRTSELTTDGVVYEFDFDMLIHASTEVQVWYEVSGSEYTQLILETDYGVVFTEDGGTVSTDTYTAPLAAGKILIIRNIPLTMQTNWLWLDNHSEQQHQDDFDRSVMRDLQIQEQLDRTLQLPPTSGETGLTFPEPDASKFLQWKTDESGLENVSAVDIDAVSDLPYDATLWDGDANAASKNAIRDKIESMDYAFVSANDAATDITAAQLEQLSDGSDTALHIHDQFYYTKDEVNDIVEGNTFDFFLNNTNSDISAPTQYFVMDPTETGDGASTFSDTITGDNFLIDTWATSTSEPTFSALVSGIYAFHIHGETTTGANVGTVRLYWELYSRIADDPFTETLLITSEESNILVGAETEYDIHGILATDVVLDVTDRLVLKVYANIEVSRPTDPLVTLTAEGTTAAHFEVVTTITAFDDRYVFVTGDTMTGPLTILTTTIQDETVNPTGASEFTAGQITTTNDYMHYKIPANNFCEADGTFPTFGTPITGDYIAIKGSGVVRLAIFGNLPIFHMEDINAGVNNKHWLSLLADDEFRWNIANDDGGIKLTPLVMNMLDGAIAFGADISVGGDIEIQDGGFIGSDTTPEAILIDADGDVNLVKDLFIGGEFSDGTLSILNGEITEIARLAGDDLDIFGGTGTWTTSGPLNAGAATFTSIDTPTGRTATMVIAASNASTTVKNQADLVCDGTADEVQINAAIGIVESIGGIIHLSAGTFSISAPIVLKKGVSIHGSGVGSPGGIGDTGTIIVLANNSNCDMMTFDATIDSINPTFIVLKEFILDGNKTNQSSGHGIAIIPTTPTIAKDFGFYHVWVWRAKEDGFHVEGGWGFVFDKCLAETCDGNGFYGTGMSQCYYTGGFSAYNKVSQMKFDDAYLFNDKVIIANNNFKISDNDVTGAMVHLDNFNDSLCVNNEFFLSGASAIAGIYFTDSANSLISSNGLRDSGSGTAGIHIDQSGSYNCISNNVVRGWPIGILVQSADGTASYDILTGNMLLNNTKSLQARLNTEADTENFFMQQWWVNALETTSMIPTAYTPSVSNWTLTTRHNGGMFTQKSGRNQRVNLPVATVSLEFTFVVSETFQMRINPQDAETLNKVQDGVQLAAGEYCYSSTIGDSIRFRCVKAGEWQAFDVIGTWIEETP